MKNEIEKEQPIYTTDMLTINTKTLEDVADLLKAFYDKEAVRRLNSKNKNKSNGDDFDNCTTAEKVKMGVDFWQYSFEHSDVTHYKIILNATKNQIGNLVIDKIETEDKLKKLGVLTIDLENKYEKQQYINDILEIVNQYFYEALGVDFMLTKAKSKEKERITSLNTKGYITNKEFKGYKGYFVR